MLGIIANLFLFIIKIIVAVLSKSQGLFADAINSGTDIFTSFMTYIGNKLASKPEDKEHPYGHGKVEYVFSLIISICMIGLSFKILQDAITSIIQKSEIIFSFYLVIVCIATIIIKLVLYIYTTKIGKQYENLLITAASEDHRNDIFLSLATLFGIIAAKFGFNFIDGLVGILISIWIAYIAIKLFLSAYDVLIDTDINDNLKSKVISVINEENKCIIDSIKSRPVGVNYILLLEISVEKNITLEEAHNIAEDIKQKVCTIDKIVDAIIHVNA
ncbi:MAG: cation diffusion facilitator family transporter [Clostridia bacterium]